LAGRSRAHTRRGRCTQWPLGAQTGSILAPPTGRSQRGGASTASNLDTHSTWVGRGAHAVEFSKTAAPPGRGVIPLRGTPGVRFPDPGADLPM